VNSVTEQHTRVHYHRSQLLAEGCDPTARSPWRGIPQQLEFQLREVTGRKQIDSLLPALGFSCCSIVVPSFECGVSGSSSCEASDVMVSGALSKDVPVN